MNNSEIYKQIAENPNEFRENPGKSVDFPGFFRIFSGFCFGVETTYWVASFKRVARFECNVFKN